MTRVLVTGGRDYGEVDPHCPPDPQHEHRAQKRAECFILWETLDTYHVDHGITCIIHGGARGADRLAHYWAKRKLIPIEAFPADWKQHGRAAGPLRNAQMIAEGKPDIVIAFPGGFGTADCTDKARAAGLEVIVVGDHPTRPQKERASAP